MQIKEYVLKKKDEILQNLMDADCSQEIIEQFMKNIEEDNENQALKILEKHRKTLLDRVHKDEKYINCLDYLLYSLKL